MEQINSIINFFQDMTQEKVINIVIAITIILVFSLLSSALSYFIVKLFKWKEKDKKKIKANAFYNPLRVLFIIIGIYIAITILNLPQDVMKWFNKAFKIAMICIVAKGLVNIFEPKSILMEKISKSNRIGGNRTLANFIGKIVKGIIYLAAGVLIISELGYNLNGLIAGLGLSSVVIALAAQDIAKSLFAGASILLDKPFVVGDWIQASGYEGTVVDITFKSTRLKTMEDTVVTIQNSKLSEESIVNYAKMKKRRYGFNIKLPLQTNSDTVEAIINRVKFVLKHNKNIEKDSIIVECNSILEDGLNLMIAMYTPIIPYVDYLKFRTSINETILNVIESEGIRLANPSQDVYVKTIEKELVRAETKKKTNS